MAKRKKRLIKQEKGLLKQVEKHLIKIKTEAGKKDTTIAYWKREIKDFLEQAKYRKEKLEKLKKVKKLSKT